MRSSANGQPVETTTGSGSINVNGLPALISIPLAAKILGLSRASAYRYAAAEELPIKRLGGRVYVITARLRPLFDGIDEVAA
ncbi:helix-turn-helix domain-containing protein [Luedemannella helvata]|uniref:Helix-turn-helix domain-containing protein n=1 Tax=Luedemannella helvata TaxID=349315 RepID=A0ABN2L585_9ACTN